MIVDIKLFEQIGLSTELIEALRNSPNYEASTFSVNSQVDSELIFNNDINECVIDSLNINATNNFVFNSKVG